MCPFRSTQDDDGSCVNNCVFYNRINETCRLLQACNDIDKIQWSLNQLDFISSEVSHIHSAVNRLNK